MLKAFLGEAVTELQGMRVRNLWIKTSWETQTHCELVTEDEVVPLKDKTVYAFSVSGDVIKISPGIQVDNDRHNTFQLVKSINEVG